jgi:anti-sigma factor RsiW
VTLAAGTMMKLMAYADGELDAADRKDIEALLAKDEEAKKIVAQMRSLGAVVAAVHPKVPEIDIADAVMAKVKDTKPEPGGRDKTNVVSLADRRASRAKIGVAVAAVLALAASIVIWSRPKETPLAELPKPVPQAQVAIPEPGIVVEPIDSPGQTVKVIYGPGKDEMQTSVIIWVDEERK